MLAVRQTRSSGPVDPYDPPVTPFIRRLGPLARVPLLTTVAAFGVALVAFTWIATLERIDDERATTRRHAERIGAAMARGEAERATVLFRQVEQAARFLKVAYESGDANGVIAALQRGDLLPVGTHAVIAIADGDGNLVATSQDAKNNGKQAPAKPPSVADRTYFQVQLKAAGDRLYIGTPVVSRLTGAWMMPSSRRLIGPDGRFAGIVMVAVDVDYLTDFYDPATQGDRGTVSLVNRDGVVLVNRTGSTTRYGDRLDPAAADPLLAQPGGTRTMIGPFDETERLVSFRALDDLPIVALYGVATADVYEAFEVRRRGYLAAATIVSALCIAGGALLIVLGIGMHRGVAHAGRSEQQLKAITDNIPALVSYIDNDQRFRFANPMYREWLGVEPSALIGRTLRDVYGDTQYEVMRPRIEAALAGNRVEYERRLTGNGRTRDVHVLTVPAHGPDGRQAGLFVLINDVSMFKQAESSIRRSEDQLRLIADTLPMRVSFIDADERYRFNNLAYERHYNVVRASMVGKTIREVIGDEAYLELQPWVRRALAGDTITFTRDVVGEDGVRTIESTYIPNFDVDGKTVLGFQAIINDVTMSKREERRLRQLTETDPLTGVANRTGFIERLEQALEESRADKSSIAVMYLDIDRFKQINDTHGHAVGDALLKAFAARLMRALRVTDVVARLGGDEFAILLHSLPDPADAGFVADKILEEVRRAFKVDALRFEVTTSIGIATVTAGAASPDALLKVADESMYRAKQTGRNSWKSSNVAKVLDPAL